MYRLDIGEVTNTKTTAQGYLKTKARVGRTGVLVYRKTDGSIRRELRPLEELYADASIETLTNAPVVNEHPVDNGGELTIDNTDKHIVGYAGNNVEKEDNKFLAINVTIFNKKTIQELSKKKEISAGYFCDHECTPGIWEGQPYDVIQRNIRYNHVAIVPRGRAGSDVRLMLDSEIIEGEILMKTITIDSQEFEVAENIASVIQNKLNQDAKDTAEIKSQIAELTAKIKELTAEKEALMEEMGLVKESNKKMDSEISTLKNPEIIQSAVKERVSLEKRAAKFLEGKLNIDSLSNADLKKAVISGRLTGVNLDNASEDFINGLFEASISISNYSPTAAAISKINSDSVVDKSDVNAARKHFIDRQKFNPKGN